MLQTACTKHQKIPEKSELMIEFLIGLHYKNLNWKIMLKVDMGSDINCISLGTFHKLFPHQQLTKSTLLLENYGNSPMSIIGKFKVFIWWKGKVFHQEFYVTNANSSPNLLSRDASFQMEVLQTCFTVTGKEIPSWTKQGNRYIESHVSQSTLNMPSTTLTCVSQSTLNMPTIISTSVSQWPLTREKILEVHTDIFDSLGTFPEEPYKFRLKENHVIARHAPRKVLIHLQDDFHAKIHDLVKHGVLEKVEHSTEWVNSFVIVEKDFSMDSWNIQTPNRKFKKRLRICLDPRDLREALKHEPYCSWSVDELIAKFHGCKVFSFIDIGYWMVPLHPESRPLTCMSIDIGRYQWTWLPVGINVTSDVFQKKLGEIFQNVQGLTGIADDMIIYRKSWEEHDVHFLNFLSVMRKNNLQLNDSILQFQLKEVSFLDTNGIPYDDQLLK